MGQDIEAGTVEGSDTVEAGSAGAVVMAAAGAGGLMLPDPMALTMA